MCRDVSTEASNQSTGHPPPSELNVNSCYLCVWHVTLLLSGAGPVLIQVCLRVTSPFPAHPSTPRTLPLTSLSSPSHTLPTHPSLFTHSPPTPFTCPLPHPLTLLTLPLPSPTHSPHPLTPLPSHSLTLHTLQHCTGRSRTGVPRHRQVRVSPHGVGRLCNRTLSSNSGTDGDTQLAI